MTAPPRRASPPEPRLTGGLDSLVAASVVALAWWTVLFHLASPLRWPRDGIGAVWVGGLVVMAGLAVGLRTRAARPARLRPVAPVPGWAVAGLVGLVLAAAAVSATRWPDERPEWWLFWALMVGAAAGALLLVVRAPERPAGDDARVPVPTSVAAALLVVVVALTAAAGSALTQRPDADDVFLVNRSTYVAEHSGPLPERDTLFSDEVFAVTRPDAVPTAIEPLVGMLAAWTPLTAASVTYLLLGPLVSALGMLALWRMLRTLGAAAPALALAAAAAFLLLDGASHASFGNFSFARAWQGKVIFLLLVVPSLWHHALRWSRDGSRRDLGLLLAANVAGIGLTTTGVILGPAVTLVVALGGAWGTGTWRRLSPALATSLPAALAAVAFSVLPRQDPTPVLAWIPPWFTLSGGIEPGRQWHWIYDEGVGLLVPAAAACVAWALVRDRSARLALVLAPLLLFGVVYGPGTLDAIADVTGVRSILWRTGWILPVPAAVGLVITAPMAFGRDPRLRFGGTALCAAVVLGTMAVGSTWVLDRDGGTQGVHVGGFRWDVDPGDRTAAQRLIDLSEPGDAVLAPERVGQVIAIQTTRVRALNPRNQYMTGRHAVPEFHAEGRQRLTLAVTIGAEPADVDALRQDLDDLHVATVCVAPAAQQSQPLQAALGAAGFTTVAADEGCEYLRRTDPGL